MSKNIDIEQKKSIAKIDSMSAGALKKYAEKQSAEILEEIQDAFWEIDNYKTSAEEKAEIEGVGQHFKNIFSGGAYKRDKSIEAIQNTLSRMKADSATAMFKILTIVEKSVMFTCSSTKLASQMTSTISVMMAKGFVDSNGNVRQLDENTREFASFIMGQADMFVQNQNEHEERMSFLEGLIHDLNNIKADQDIRIDKALDATEKNKIVIQRLSKESKKQDELIKKQKANSQKKEEEQDEAIRRQVEKDIEQDNRLENTEKKDKDQDWELVRQAKKDKEHDDKLRIVEIKDAEQDEAIQRQIIKDKEHDRLFLEKEVIDNAQDEKIKSNIDEIKRLKNLITTLMDYDYEKSKLLDELLLENKRSKLKNFAKRKKHVKYFKHYYF